MRGKKKKLGGKRIHAEMKYMNYRKSFIEVTQRRERRNRETSRRKKNLKKNNKGKKNNTKEMKAEKKKNVSMIEKFISQ